MRWGTFILAAIVMAEGVGKALDLSGYLAALEAFRFADASTVRIVGMVWTAVELASGVGLFLVAAGATKRIHWWPALGALIASIGYAVLTVRATLLGLVIDNCTCFGVFLAQRLSWFVLLQDAYMIAFSAWQLYKLRQERVRQR